MAGPEGQLIVAQRFIAGKSLKESTLPLCRKLARSSCFWSEAPIKKAFLQAHQNGNLPLRKPILVIPQEVSFVKRIERGLKEHPDNVRVSHLLEAAIGGENASIDQPEAPRRNLFAQQIVFRVERLLVKSSELVEFGLLEHHEHARAERLSKLRDKLDDIVAQV